MKTIENGVITIRVTIMLKNITAYKNTISRHYIELDVPFNEKPCQVLVENMLKGLISEDVFINIY